jgi:peptidoglycan-N-acetylmuramic acid deacetylase
MCLCACSTKTNSTIPQDTHSQTSDIFVENTISTGTNETDEKNIENGEKISSEQTTIEATEVAALDKDYSSLDNTIQNWGQGVQFDDLNRPISAVEFQEKYYKLSADFVKTDAQETKTIYLTFDEGYENGYTSQILDILKEKKTSAVFFVTLPYAKENPDLIKRMIAEGHVVGNHSSSHPANGMPSLSIKEQQDDIMELHDYIKTNFDNYEMTLFRFPAGKFSEQSLAVVKDLGYRSVFWSFAHADWDPDNQPDETASLQKLVDRLHPGAIYLLHAVSKTDTDILGEFIEQAQSNGYTFQAYQ